jgi:cytoskeletal protein RodZ
MKELGIILKQKREDKHIDIDVAAKDLRIRNHYLTEIEEGNFSLENIYMMGYVKNYANYLKVGIKDFIENTKTPHSHPEEKQSIKEKLHFDSTSPEPIIVIIAVICIIISAVILVFLNNLNFNTNITNSFISQEVSNGPEKNIVNSFETKITGITEDVNIEVIANNATEISVFNAQDELVLRERLQNGGKLKFLGKDNDQLKFITNTPNALEILFEKKS